jgi:hypothetical protein
MIYKEPERTGDVERGIGFQPQHQSKVLLQRQGRKNVNTSLSKSACAIGLHDAKLEYHDGKNISYLVQIGDTAIHTPPPILTHTHFSITTCRATLFIHTKSQKERKKKKGTRSEDQNRP